MGGRHGNTWEEHMKNFEEVLRHPSLRGKTFVPKKTFQIRTKKYLFSVQVLIFSLRRYRANQPAVELDAERCAQSSNYRQVLKIIFNIILIEIIITFSIFIIIIVPN